MPWIHQYARSRVILTSKALLLGFQHVSKRRSSRCTREVVFSGIQPTGIPHLGNYLGAIQSWVHLQDEALPSTQLIFSIVDLHAITVRQTAQQLRRWKRETLASLLAVGLNPDRCIIFYQSEVKAHAELMWILSCTASIGYLSRMTQWKSKLALPDEISILDPSAKAKLKLGLFSYPVLQAADILLYGTTQVPVGEDQVQHLEFARECANNFNSAHGPIFRKPRTLLSLARRVMSLKEPQLKMSKSHDDSRSRILITDDHEEIHTKIKLALTDSMQGVSFDPVTRPGVSNLLALVSFLNNGRPTCEEVAQQYSALSMHDFKSMVASTINEHLSGIRARYDLLMNADDGRYLDDVARVGADKARKEAEKTMTLVRHAIGL